MNKIAFSAFLLGSVMFFTSCGSNNDKTEVSKEQKVEVEEEETDSTLIAKNEDIKNYVENMNKAIDEYIKMAEDLAKNTTAIGEGTGSIEDLQKIAQAGQSMANSFEKLKPIMDKIEGMKNNKENIIGKLNPKQKEVFMRVFDKMIARFIDASLKKK